MAVQNLLVQMHMTEGHPFESLRERGRSHRLRRYGRKVWNTFWDEMGGSAKSQMERTFLYSERPGRLGGNVGKDPVVRSASAHNS